MLPSVSRVATGNATLTQPDNDKVKKQTKLPSFFAGNAIPTQFDGEKEDVQDGMGWDLSNSGN